MKKRVGIIDIETSGLLADMLDYSQFPYKLNAEAKIWVVSVTDLSDMSTKSLVKEEITKETLDNILKDFTLLVAHNGIKFDLPALQLFGLIDYSIGYLGESDKLNGRDIRIVDSLIMSRFINPDRFGGHSLSVWGERVGVSKTDYRGELIELGFIDPSLPKGDEFKLFHPSMVSYCEQDTITNAHVYAEILKEYVGYDTAKMGLQLEHKLADLSIRRETLGFWFDKDLAIQNLDELTGIMETISKKVNPILPRKSFTKTELNHFTPPATQFKKDGSWSSHMLKFFDKHNITDFNEEGKWFKYQGNLYECPTELALEDSREATVDDLDVVKEYLIELGWVPSEWAERDITRDSKKQLLPLEKRDKAIKRYVDETLSGKYTKGRLSVIGTTADKLYAKIISETRGTRPFKLPTAPKIRVGVTKDMCPKLIELGDKVEFAKDVADYYTYRHRKSAIAGGDIEDMDFDEETPNTGYLSNYRESDGRIPTPAIEIGAGTHRYRHIGVANIPRTSSLFGDKMRAMFGAGKDFVQFGFDYASLEARIEGHYIYDYEGGAEMAVSLLAEKPNDIHTKTAEKLEIKRDDAKSVNYACLPIDNTEVLTKDGWKYYSNLNIGDIVLTYNTEKDFIEEDIILNTVDFDNKDIIRMSNSRDVLESTSEHRWFGKQRHSPKKKGRYFRSCFKTTDEINSEFNILMSSKTNLNGELSCVRKARILGWLLSDGYYKWSTSDRNKNRGVTGMIAQSVNKYCKELEQDLNSADLSYKVDLDVKDNGNNVRRYRLLSKDVRELLTYYGVTTNKYETDWTKVLLKMSTEAISGFLEAFYLADGGNRVITQNKGSVHEAIALAYYFMGNRISIVDKGQKCSVIKSHNTSYITCQKLVKENIGARPSFCITTKNGTFIIRQNKKLITITGNCLYGASSSKFVKMLGMTKQEADAFHKAWWDLNSPLKELKQDKDQEWVRSGKKFILSIDGRRINIRSQHSILNALFQSAGVICAKYITVLMSKKFEEAGLCIDVFKGRPVIGGMIEYHDENQLVTDKSLLKFKVFKTKDEAKEFVSKWEGEQLGAIQEGSGGKFYITLPNIISNTILESIKEVEELFSMKVSLGMEYVTGNNWKDCH